jgi:DNA transposition AAA+ family ATPase
MANPLDTQSGAQKSTKLTEYVRKHNPAFSIEPSPNRGAFKLKEACLYAGGLAPITMRRLIDRGLIRRHPSIRHIVIAKTELDRFLAA